MLCLEQMILKRFSAIAALRSVPLHQRQSKDTNCSKELSLFTCQSAGCLIYAQALLEYVIIIMWLRSFIKMLRSVKFAEDKVLTFFILREKC